MSAALFPALYGTEDHCPNCRRRCPMTDAAILEELSEFYIALTFIIRIKYLGILKKGGRSTSLFLLI